MGGQTYFWRKPLKLNWQSNGPARITTGQGFAPGRPVRKITWHETTVEERRYAMNEMDEVVSLEGPVLKINGELMLMIPLDAGGRGWWIVRAVSPKWKASF